MAELTLHTLRRSLSFAREGLRYALTPGDSEAWPEGDRARTLLRWRVALILVAMAMNSLLMLTIGSDAGLRQDVARKGILACNGLFALNLALTAMWLRRAGTRSYAWVLSICSLLEIATAMIWIQLTGTASSYFLATPVFLAITYRLVVNYWLALIGTVGILIMYLSAYALEQQGVLEQAPMLVDGVGPGYGSAGFRQMVVISIVNSVAFNFLAANAYAKYLRGNVLRLERAQRDLQRAVERVRAGRLSGFRLGPYQLGDLLGRGGMGEVYDARRDSDGERVAVKVLHSHLADEVGRARFRREADVSARLPPGTVARLIDVGTSPDGDDFIVMERLIGEDLAALLRRRERLTPSETVAIVDQVAAALDAAHDLGVVHRDLKPQNVFLCAGEDRAAARVRVLDFGVARLLERAEESDHALTATAAVIGTPGYIPPEQARGGAKAVGPQADVFALAVIAYRALTGRPAFPAREPNVALLEVLTHEPLPASALARDLPPGADGVLRRGMAKDPCERYQRAGGFARDLRGALVSVLVAHGPSGDGEMPASTSAEQTLEQTMTDPEAIKRRE